jgi:ketosteroid isomerase-like protein
MRLTSVLLIPFACATLGAQSPAGAHAGIDAFNRAFADATRHMDNAATLALWDDDGVNLLPSTEPINGKPAITKFMNDVMSSLAGAHMKSFESTCFDIHASGDWASEWCTEHQIVELPNGKPPFDGYGKMLLVLHRGADRKWRLHDEMWNQGLAPNAKPS